MPSGHPAVIQTKGRSVATVATESGGRSELFLEIVRVDLGNLGRTRCYADFVLDHQFGKPNAVNQHDTFDGICEVGRLFREIRGSDEDTLVGYIRLSQLMKCANEAVS